MSNFPHRCKKKKNSQSSTVFSASRKRSMVFSLGIVDTKIRGSKLFLVFSRSIDYELHYHNIYLVLAMNTRRLRNHETPTDLCREQEVHHFPSTDFRGVLGSRPRYLRESARGSLLYRENWSKSKHSVRDESVLQLGSPVMREIRDSPRSGRSAGRPAGSARDRSIEFSFGIYDERRNYSRSKTCTINERTRRSV